MFGLKRKVSDADVGAKGPVDLIPHSLSVPMEMGKIFMESGMFTDVKTQAQAVVKILAGRELGLSPLESMTNVYIVNGKIALQAKVIGALVKKSGKYDYETEQLDDKGCVIKFFRLDYDGENKITRVEIGKSSFSFLDASKALLINKDVWKKYPRNMMFARALSNGTKWYTPDVFCGYTNEEVENINHSEIPTTVEYDNDGNPIKKENENNG